MTVKSREAGWKEAQRRFAAEACEECGATSRLVRHHADRNPCHNAVDNVVVLCRAHHASLHAREDGTQRGERNSQSKLTEDAVRRIRGAGGTNAALGRQFGVRNRKVWTHVA